MSERKVQVIIVGAGLAGLTAAMELQKQGISFIILEARDRIGGRIYSKIEEGLVVDYGAQWVSSRQPRVMAMLKQFGIQTTPTYSEGLTYFELQGRIRWGRSTALPLPVPAMLDLRLLQRSLMKLQQKVDPKAPWAGDWARRIDSLSIEAWLEERTMLSKYGKTLFRIMAEEGLCGDLSEFSMLEALWFIASCGGLNPVLQAEEAWITPGAHTLPQRMAETLGAGVRLNAAVRRLEWTSDSVRVLTDDGQAWDGSQAILAMPPAFTGRIQYDPPLPCTRDLLCQRVGQGSVMKCVIVYEKPFWREKGCSGSSIMDWGSVRSTLDITASGQTKGVLTAFIPGKESRRLTELSPDARRREILNELARPFGPEALQPLAFHFKDWLHDPWTRGGYAAHLAPGVLTQYGAALWEPIGPLHWAGTETATEWRLFMEGAMESGERAAAEAAEALRSRGRSR